MLIINKKRLLVTFIVLIIVASILVVGCTNSITKTKETENVVRNLRKQDFVFLNYLQRLDESVILNNMSDFATASRSACHLPTVRTFVDNLQDIYDEELFNEIISLSNALYGTEVNIISPFSFEAREAYLSRLGARADYPACDFDFSILGIYANPQYSSFNQHEVNHLYNLLHSINNNSSSFQVAINFIESTSNNPNFSVKYQTILDSASNSLNFYLDNDMGFSNCVLASVLVIDLANRFCNPEDDKLFMIVPLLKKAVSKIKHAFNLNGGASIPCECPPCTCCP